MATSIYLGNPPENIKKWIMENYVEPVIDMTNVPLHFTLDDSSDTGSVVLYCREWSERNSWSGDSVPSYAMFEYSIDNMNTWLDFGTTINLTRNTPTVYLRAKYGNVPENPNLKGLTFDVYLHQLILDHVNKINGNIIYLLTNNGLVTDIPDSCFSGLFNDGAGAGLILGPFLPTNINLNAYSGLFTDSFSENITFTNNTFLEISNLINNYGLLGDRVIDREKLKTIKCSDKTLLCYFDFNSEKYIIEDPTSPDFYTLNTCAKYTDETTWLDFINNSINSSNIPNVSNIKEIIFGKPITNIADMLFNYCTNLTTVSMHQTLYSNLCQCIGVFEGCFSISSFPTLTTDLVKNFINCGAFNCGVNANQDGPAEYTITCKDGIVHAIGIWNDGPDGWNITITSF